MAAISSKSFGLPALRIFNSSRFRWSNGTRFYALYPSPMYAEPINDKKVIEKIVEEKVPEEILGMKVKPASNSQTCSVLYHPDVEKFKNYLMNHGRREVATRVLNNAFTRVKHIQIRKYNAETDPEKKKDILLNPLEVFLLAVKNATPMLWTMKIKRSGTWYKIPIGISEEKARARGMKWIYEVACDKDSKIPLEVQLAHEIISTANYEGRVIAKKIELHKLCESNRGYVHYWWT